MSEGLQAISRHRLLASISSKVSGNSRRLLFFLDLPTVHLILKFRELRANFYKELWQQAAANIGAECHDWGSGFLRIRRQNLSTVVRLHQVMLDNALMLNIMGNKALCYGLYEELGIHVPEHLEFTLGNLEAAERFLRGSPTPVVIKPVSGTGGGRGVTTGIRTPEDLRRASRRAARHGPNLLAERQLAGRSFRLLFLDGRYLDAVKRDSPHLKGDGHSSIRQLVRQENRKRLETRPITALSPLLIDPDSRIHLKEQSLSLSTKPAAGQRIEFKHVVNENTAEENHNVRTDVHPETIETAAKLVNAIGVKLAGVDIIASDISQPLTRDNGQICEINTTPGLHHHYLINDKKNVVPVATEILDYLFNTGQGMIGA